MADDGLLLNFAAGDLPTLGSTPKFKGGSWRERSRLINAARTGRDLRLGQQHEGRQQAFERATAGRHGQADNPSVKRRRLNSITKHENARFDDPRQNERHIPLQDGRKQKHDRPRPAHLKDAKFHTQPGDREVISSLFTYNPESKIAPKEEEPVESRSPAKPSNAPLPDGVDTFTSLGLADSVAAHLLMKMDLKTPTAIQKAAVSQLTKEDADVFIQSETGSGKTLAYLLPVVQRLLTIAERWEHERTDGTSETPHFGRDSGLLAIILAPTRELCKQISVVLEKLLGCAHFLVAGTVVGGEKKKSEKARLRKGLNILVATPGRLVDHIDNTSVLDVSKVRYLVLDEGDRLMDDGFEEDIRKILGALDGKRRKHTEIPGLPDRRVTILCSATLKSNVEKLGDLSLKDAVLVKGDDDSDTNQLQNGSSNTFLAPAQLKQSYIVCAAKLRLVTLVALLKRTFARKGSVMKAIVFVSCADSVDFHHKILTRPLSPNDEEGVALEIADAHLADALASSPILSTATNPLSVYKIHGSLPQQTRTAIIQSFAKSSTASLLVATDVASRGLDLPNLDLVIEYDPAFSKEDHLHRIGRTARLGRNGRAVIFLLPGSEEGYVQVLKESYKPSVDTNTTINVTGTSANDVLKKGFTSSSGLVGSKSTGDDHETLATEFQLDVERVVLSDSKMKDMAKNAFQSHIRAYATHVSDERKWFDIKELHLGHVAKAFGLRDPPGKVNVHGLRGKAKAGENGAKALVRPRANEGRRMTRAGDDEDGPKKVDVDDVGDEQAAREKMRALVRNRNKMMGLGADEFNIG